MEEKEFFKLGFMFEDEYGNKTELNKEISLEGIDTSVYTLVDEFKKFLLAAGFGQETVDLIECKED